MIKFDKNNIKAIWNDMVSRKRLGDGAYTLTPEEPLETGKNSDASSFINNTFAFTSTYEKLTRRVAI